MAQSIINVGTSNNSGDGEPLRSAGIKINNNFTELYQLNPDTINLLKNTFGFGFYVHDQSTPSTQVLTTTPQKLIIDGGGSTSDSDHLPLEIRGVSELWDTASNKLLPINSGDGYNIRIDLEITSKTGSPTELILDLDISGGTTPTIVAVERIINTGKTPPYMVSIGFPYFTLDTFKTNGGQIFLSTDSGTITLTKRQVSIHRISNGDL